MHMPAILGFVVVHPPPVSQDETGPIGTLPSMSHWLRRLGPSGSDPSNNVSAEIKLKKHLSHRLPGMTRWSMRQASPMSSSQKGPLQ
ncbi:unnamed protein product [Clonostachys rosea f. rosea IK726]|nr:unnamed protein product [Clonostachys rosea f. rosea IK726]